MAKRVAQDDLVEEVSLKSGERPQDSNDEETFEDDFEDEYESEDEIIEAGVDGRPDEEQGREEKGTWKTPTWCDS